MKPFVSVLIPVKNEEEHIEKCLTSLIAQDYPKDQYEIIVADNCSTDNTEGIVKSFPVHYFQTPLRKIGAVRNYLASKARGDIFAYIDGDCTVNESWLSATVALMASDNMIGAVGGYIRGPETANWIVSGWALAENEVDKKVTILATGSFFITRELFEEIGGFNDKIAAAEDTDISKRIHDAGYLLIKSPSASIVHWGFPNDPGGFIRRQIWQSSDYLRSLKKGMDLIFLATAASLFLILASLALSLAGNPQIALLSLLIMFSIWSGISLVRFKRSAERKTIKKFLAVFFVNGLYLIGRITGLSISIFRTIFHKN